MQRRGSSDPGEVADPDDSVIPGSHRGDRNGAFFLFRGRCRQGGSPVAAIGLKVPGRPLWPTFPCGLFIHHRSSYCHVHPSQAVDQLGRE